MSGFFDWLRSKNKVPNLTPLGQVDEINEDGLIVGWAFNGETSPVTITVTYNGHHVCDCVADLFRKDLQAAGIGHGNHGFRVQPPCNLDDFRAELLNIRIGDSFTLAQGAFFGHWDKVNMMYSPVTDYVNVEITSRCNLRCTYCRVSHKDYRGMDLDEVQLENFIQQLRQRRVRNVTVNGHGETTIIPGWHLTINKLSEEGFRLSIISNLARILEEDEISAMARISFISVSVDTSDAVLLRKIRRKVQLENIIRNMTAVRQSSVRMGVPEPIIGWSCVVSDRIAPGILDYVRFGLAHDVRAYNFCNLVEYPDIECDFAVRHVSALSDDDFNIFAIDFAEARRLIVDAGGSVEIAGDLAEIIELRQQSGASS